MYKRRLGICGGAFQRIHYFVPVSGFKYLCLIHDNNARIRNYIYASAENRAS
jgi:hypothetical protein